MKEHLQNMTDDLLVKYLVGEADVAEVATVERWLEKDAANQVYYQQLSTTWEESLSLAPQMRMSENAAWERFREKAVKRPAVKTMQNRMGWIRIAALLLVAAAGAITYLALTNAKERQPVQVLAAASPLTDTLPDGSVIVLNKHASLTYPGHFDKKERKVQLTGEAFFTVAHNTQQPFVVNCGTVNIAVVGTSFNVKPTANGTEVIVETGRVLVTHNNQTLLLKPGEKVFVSNTNDSMQKVVTTDRLYQYYRNREFICDATPLSKLVQVLNEAYEADIVIENKNIANLPISTVFNNEPLDKILGVIAETLNITVEKKDGKILLK